MQMMRRSDAVAAIRRKLLDLVDEERSMCQAAGQRGIYCRGFLKLTDEQLRRDYSWLLKRNPSMSRVELEDLANRWQLARQIVQDVPISCDAQTLEKDTCQGWERFDDATIARFHRELVGKDIFIEPAA